MRDTQIRAEWRRASQSLGAAEALLEAGFHEDAVSRAYYAVLHAAKAALLARDVGAESHAAVRRLFGKELVQKGLLEKEWALILAQEYDERALADYDAEYSFSREVTRQRVEEAHCFVERIRSFLRAQDVEALPDN